MDGHSVPPESWSSSSVLFCPETPVSRTALVSLPVPFFVLHLPADRVWCWHRFCRALQSLALLLKIPNRCLYSAISAWAANTRSLQRQPSIVPRLSASNHPAISSGDVQALQIPVPPPLLANRHRRVLVLVLVIEQAHDAGTSHGKSTAGLT